MRDEFVDTCGLCDAPLRMGQRCACGDNWRAAQPAPAQPARGFISVDVLSKMFEPMDGIDKHAEGYHWRRGWNDALRRAMDYATAAQPVAWFSPEQKRAMAIIQSAAKALEEGTFTAPPALHEAARMALAHIRWHSFGACRTEGWDGPPPTAREAENALTSALRAAIGEGE